MAGDKFGDLRESSITHQTKNIHISICNYNLSTDHQTFISLMLKKSEFAKLSIHQIFLQYGTFYTSSGQLYWLLY